MARDGLLIFACAAAALLTGSPSGLAAPPDDSTLADTLAVQSAMQQAREHLLHNRPREAVNVLHRELGHINGNPVYLALLRDSYQAAIKESQLSHQEAEAQRYIKWLAILEPGSARERFLHPTSPKSSPADSLTKNPEATSRQGIGSLIQAALKGIGKSETPLEGSEKDSRPPESPKPSVVRASIDEDPFNDSRSAAQDKLVRELLLRAEQEFGQRKFIEAGRLYEQAYRADNRITDTSRDRWAYCKLFHVVEVLNHRESGIRSQSSSGNPTPDAELADLEKETSEALVLAPRLEYGRHLLNEIRNRRRRSDTVVVEYQDQGRNAQGWFVGETTNFRIYHVQSQELARRAAEVAEQTRTQMYNKWFGRVASNWNPKCEIYLYPTGQDYSRATGVPSSSPGHSSFNLDGGRVMGRQIDLPCEDPANMLAAVLPHETTHVVLAGNFGDHVVPRWVDEGVAVLTEPHDKVLRHLVKLPGFYRNRQLLEVQQLLRMDDYPDPRYIDAFYAESVSVVEFLSKQKGPETFTQFVRDGLQGGYEPALQRYYGYQSFADLEQHWLQYAFGDRLSAGAANHTP
jgi:hypothetical protein